MNNCPICNYEMSVVQATCPDEREGCLVLHYETVCLKCRENNLPINKTLQEIEFLKARIKKLEKIYEI